MKLSRPRRLPWLIVGLLALGVVPFIVFVLGTTPPTLARSALQNGKHTTSTTADPTTTTSVAPTTTLAQSSTTSVTQATTTTAAPSRTTPAPVTISASPPPHIGIGISAGQDANGLNGWVPNSHIPFDYTYQYLSGGVNTGHGWQGWSSNAEFPQEYAKSAAAGGHTAVFPYYMLRQSNGPCNSCAEGNADLANLNSKTVMAAYYADFTTLMQRLGPSTYGGIAGFGGKVIVHVEPDLSGYAEQAVLDASHCYNFCTGGGNDPNNLMASVASSGDPDVTAYPNTYRGFNLAILHLRDLYAPNVELAFHISDWASLQDIGSSRDPNLNVVSLGSEVAGFARASGVGGAPAGTSNYNLVFNDVSNGDAGYYSTVMHDSSGWWDSLNVTFPNFHRWEQYLGTITNQLGKSAFVWQIPIGNQWFDTENNTNGHYQDNKISYFFNHMTELSGIKVTGLLFGSGISGSTVNFDGMKDGVTNPPPNCNSSGVSSGTVCANHTSVVSDDDGGYLRMEASAYYASSP